MEKEIELILTTRKFLIKIGELAKAINSPLNMQMKGTALTANIIQDDIAIKVSSGTIKATITIENGGIF